MRKGCGEAKGSDSKATHWKNALWHQSQPPLPKAGYMFRDVPMLCYVQLLNEDNYLYVTEGYTYFIYKVL